MKRPAIFIAISYIVGIVIGLNFNWFLVFGLCIIFLGVMLFRSYHAFRQNLICFLILIVGILRVSFVNYNVNCLYEKFKEEVNVTGNIQYIDVYNDTVRLTINIEKINNKRMNCGRCYMQISSNKDPDYKVGNTIKVRGLAKNIRKASNPGGFNKINYYYAKKIYYKMYSENIVIIKKRRFSLKRILYNIRTLIGKQIGELYSGDEEAILKKMLLGIKEDLSSEIIKQYKVAGISHLLAISGLHVSILGMSLLAILTYIIKKRNISLIITIISLWCYCGVTGFSTSTIRATIMLSFLMGAELMHERYDSLSAIAMSAIIIISYSPYQVLDVGFLLSFGAVLGIVVLSPVINKKVNKNNNPIVALLVATAAASIFTYPIIGYFFYQIPVYALVVNIVVIPFITVVLYSCILGILLSSVNVYMGLMLASSSVYILKYIEKLCEVVEKLPFNMITIGQPEMWQITLYYTIVILYLSKKDKKWLNYIELAVWSTTLLAIVVSILIGNESLKISCLNVGQGDCTVLEYQNKVYLIDTGGDISIKTEKNVGENVVLPFLYAKGYDKIDGVFISHSDFDHIYGLIEMIDDVEVGFVGLPYQYQAYEDELLIKLMELTEERKIPIYYFKQGDCFNLEKLELLCLYPNVSDEEFESNNDRSNVFLLTYNDFTMLLTGDVEAPGEEKIVKRVKDIEVDVLKVPHHGSQTSSTYSFLDKVNPTIATFSYGEHNYFGHPSYHVVMRYEDMDVKQYHIAHEGCIEIRVKENTYIVKTFETGREEIYPCKH